jgi:hypothetical protein
VPATVAAQVEVCAVVMEAGVAATVMETTVKVGAVTVILAAPVMAVYPAWAEVAMHLAVPAPEGVSTPACVMAPPVAVHVTAEL